MNCRKDVLQSSVRFQLKTLISSIPQLQVVWRSRRAACITQYQYLYEPHPKLFAQVHIQRLSSHVIIQSFDHHSVTARACWTVVLQGLIMVCILSLFLLMMLLSLRTTICSSKDSGPPTPFALHKHNLVATIFTHIIL